MKMVITKHVKTELYVLLAHLQQLDEVNKVLSDNTALHSTHLDAGLDRESIHRCIVGTAARLISFATKGKMFPHTTEIALRK
jgi:hypothetical protein